MRRVSFPVSRAARNRSPTGSSCDECDPTYSNLSSPFAPPRRASAVHLRLVSPGSRRVRPLQAPATRTLAPAAAGAVSAAPEPPRGEGPGRAGETLRQVHATGQTRDPGHCRATHPRLDHRATAHDRFPARL